MSYQEHGDVEHLVPLPRSGTTEQETSSSDDSNVQVTSLFYPVEHELIQLSTYLQFRFDDDDTDEDGEEVRKAQPSLANSPVVLEFDLIQAPISTLTSSTSPIHRSVKEKLYALQILKKNGNKYQTCQSHGCSPSLVRKWFSVKQEMQSWLHQKNGDLS